MAKTAIQEKGTSKKKPAPALTDAKKSQQEKKALASAQNDAKKQRKEQAKQEAKLMLKTERAKKDVQKAEQKLAKAQTRLEEARTQQQTVEQKLAELRTPRPTEVSHNGVPEASDTPLTSIAQVEDTSLPLTTPFITQSADTSDTIEVPATSVAEAHEETATSGTSADNTDASDLDQPAVEGHTDTVTASQEQETATATETPVNETPATEGADIQISSDDASMPLISHDANTWPPPLIREEVAEAAKEVETSDAAAASQETHAHDEGTQNSSSAEENETEGQADGSGDSTTRRWTRKTTD